MNQFFQWLSDLFRGVKFWAVVLPWERAVRVRLGRWVAMWEPGPHWRIPFLDEVRVVNTRMRIASVPCVTVTTMDGKTVTAAGYVAFRLSDPYKVLLTIQHPEDAAGALAAFADYIVSRRVMALSTRQMEEGALAILRKTALAGFEFDFVKVVDFEVVRTFRLLQEQWRPSTGASNLEPPQGPQ